MLCAKRKLTGETISAYFADRLHAPFVCPDCNEDVILKAGRRSVNHFAHVNPLACENASNESEEHRRCKLEIFDELKKNPYVTHVGLERRIGNNRPDVSARIRGVPVAIEVQISSLSLETITRRTIEYASNGVYVLWLLQWTPELDARRYTPRLWEKWIHATYFGRVYYWTEGLNVVPYRFEPCFKAIPKQTWYSAKGERVSAGGYSRRSKRYRTPVRGRALHLVNDFTGKQRYWWEGNEFKIPDAKLFLDIEGISRN